MQDLQDDNPVPSLSWLASSLAAAIAIVVMQMTKTTHPPAGATALLPVVEPVINRLDWYFLPVVLLSSVLVLVVALLNNNIQRRYPVFWWAPPQLPKPKPEPGATQAGLPTSNAALMVDEKEKSNSQVTSPPRSLSRLSLQQGQNDNIV